MVYVSSSGDEFPEVDTIVRKYKQEVQGKREGSGSKENGPAAKDSSATAAAKATPLRRRNLGQTQTIDSWLSKPRTEFDVDREPGRKAEKSKASRVRPREGIVDSELDSARGLLDRFAPGTQKVESVTLSADEKLDGSPEQPKRSRRLVSRRELKLKKSYSAKAEKSEMSSRESEVESEAEQDGFEPSEDSLSDFIATSDSETEAEHSDSDSDSDIFVTPPTRRSKSPADKRQKPLRLLSSSKDPVKKTARGTGRTSNRNEPSTIDPTKRPVAQNLEEKRKSKPTKETQKRNLEDDFQKLQIFNEDSDSENTNSKGDKNATRGPSTPKKTTLPPSPSKGPTIPVSPWKPEHREFWDPEVNFAWIDKHSPPKRSNPEKKKLDLTAGEPADSSSKEEMKRRYGNSPEKRDAKKAFDAAKGSLARDFLQELDQRITEGRLARMTEATGGLRIVWSNTLLTTAGRAHWKCKTVTTMTSSQAKDKGTAAAAATDGMPTTTTATITKTEYQHHASIELASKVLANRADLLNTVAHEFCHLAVFMLHGKPKLAHGPEFKAWGRRCGAAFADRGIDVTTKHSYEIEYKYIWRCADCAGEVKRHSKSVDPVRQRCGACRGVLVQVRPVPRGGSANSDGAGAGAGAGEDGTKTVKKKQTAWQEFMGKEMKALSQSNKSMSFKDKMACVSAKWAEQQKATKGLAAAVEVLEIRDDGEGDDGGKGNGKGKGEVRVTYDLFA